MRNGDTLKPLGVLLLLLATSACSSAELLRSTATFERSTIRRGTDAVTQPPRSGPGSNVYKHGAYRRSAYSFAGRRYWIYEPASPAPKSAPVILYLHGYLYNSPANYEDMLIHFARKGYIVVFPAMGAATEIRSYQKNSTTAFQQALARLQDGSHVRPELDKVVYAGHSLGAVVGLHMANDAKDKTFPKPLALVLHEVAGEQVVPLDDLSKINPKTFLIMISKANWDHDTLDLSSVKKAWCNTLQIPSSRKNVIGIPSASHGSLTLISDHFGVQSCRKCKKPQPLDGIDWWGYWRPTEAVLDYVFRGTHKDYFLGDGWMVRNMGNWDDGTPVLEKKTAKDYPILFRKRH